MSELQVTERERVAPGRWMNTKATLYRDGTLKLENNSWSRHFTRGLRGHSLYAILIKDDKALYLSPVHFPKTVAGEGDWHGDSDVYQTFVDSIPEAIAESVTKIDMIHNSGSLHGQWDRHKTTIKHAVRDATEISEDIKALIDTW